MSWEEVEFRSLFSEPTRNGVYKTKEFHGSGVPIVNMGEMFRYDRIGGQAMSLRQMSDRELTKAGLMEGDLLFGRRSLVESGAGKCSLVYQPNGPLTFESSIIRARLDLAQADPEFYFNYFRSPIGRSRVVAIVSGATVKGIRSSDLSAIRVHKPPLSQQIAIRHVLSAYDNLIATNQRRIQLLEGSGRRLYCEWFVHLRFPGHESVQVRDGVPNGWAAGTLSDLADINASSIGAKERPESVLYVDISSVATGTIEKVTPYLFTEAPGRARRRVCHGDVIWSCVRPNRRSYALIWEPDENLVVSTGFAVISAKDVPFSYLYFVATTDNFVGYLEQNATGAAYPAVTAKVFETASALRPEPKVMKEFDDCVLPMLQQMETLKTQNIELAKARDLLLPTLMSGQLDVSRVQLPAPSVAS